ncbi:MAG: rod shape-determining protein MreC [Spirochaetia bacterium]|nr:rod shape-determining protein MreC [Spirochaetia bacterium]
MGFTLSRDFPELRAEVLGVRLDSISPRILIGKGKNDGLVPFMPVIAHAHDADDNTIRAVVGIVASVDSTTAIVQPIFHPAFKLGVRIPDTGEWALLTGNSGNVTEALLTYITSDLKNAPAKDSKDPKPTGLKNLTIFTSGGSGIFPKGIPVGKISREGTRQGDTRTAFVKPFADIGELDYVVVILKKPEPWKSRWDRDDNWDDNLRTEFGAPQFPEMEIKPRQPKRERAATPLEKDQGEPGKDKKDDGETGPRKIQNVNQ